MSNTKRPQNPQLAEQPSKATPLIIGLVVLLCVGAIIAIAALVKGGDDGGTPAAAGDTSTQATSEAPSTDQPSTGGTSGAALDCSPAPEVPGPGPQSDAPPSADLSENTTWVATVTTNCGDITMELDGAKAPQTVASFIDLSQKGYYDDSPCHRLTTSGLFVLQCGDPTGQGSGGPGYGYGIENAPETGDYPTGTLAMARTSDPNSNGSQFFIVYKDTQLPVEGGGYSIFGQVTGGLDIVQAIADAGVDGGASDGAPAQPISILSVDVAKK